MAHVPKGKGPEPIKKLPQLIRAAQRALDAERPDEALAPLLDAWRLRRDSQLADLIDAVSAAADEPLADIEGATVRERLQAARALLAAQHPEDLPRILRVFADYFRAATGKRLREELLRWPRDPRLPATVIPLLPLNTPYGYRVQQDLLQLICQQEDPRVLQRLAALRFTGEGEGLEHGARWQIADAIADHGSVEEEPLPQELARIVEALLRARRPELDVVDDSELRQQLLSAVYADPGSDEPRAVYADWLQERGDPHGELIALQLTQAERKLRPEEKRRVDALLEEHADEWVDALKPYLREEVEFARGFPSKVSIAPHADEALGETAWSTVETAIFPRGGPVLELLASDCLKGLRHVRDVSVSAIPDLVEFHAELVSVHIWDVPDTTQTVCEEGALPALDQLAYLEKLSTLGFRWCHPAALASYWKRRSVPKGLEALALFNSEWATYHGVDHQGDLIAERSWNTSRQRFSRRSSALDFAQAHARAVPSRIRTISVGEHWGSGWSCSLERDAQGQFSKLRAHWRRGAEQTLVSQRDDLVAFFAQSACHDYTELNISAERSLRWSQRDLSALQAALKPQKRLISCSLPEPWR